MRFTRLASVVLAVLTLTACDQATTLTAPSSEPSKSFTNYDQEIVTMRNDLYVAIEQAQTAAWETDLTNNPNAWTFGGTVPLSNLGWRDAWTKATEHCSSEMGALLIDTAILIGATTTAAAALSDPALTVVAGAGLRVAVLGALGRQAQSYGKLGACMNSH
jgi:hypothetical protein